MANMDVTNIDKGSVVIPGEETAYEDAVLTAGGAGTIKEGTILARSSVSGNLVPFAVGGGNGSDTPVAVLPYAVVATGAGDIPVRALTHGKVNLSRLVIAADGDGDNITNAQRDALRSFGITPVAVEQLSALDNQA